MRDQSEMQSVPKREGVYVLVHAEIKKMEGSPLTQVREDMR